MRSFDHKLPPRPSQADLLALVAPLNADQPCTASWCSCRCRQQIDPQTRC